MNYQIKMSGGETYRVTEQEAVELMSNDKKGLIGVKSLKGVINMSFVISIIPEDKIDRSKMTTGRLHDGTRVVKRFGEWKNAENPDFYLEYRFYPEIFKDGVMTEEEYQKEQIVLQYLRENTPESIKNCEECKGIGIIEDFLGEYTYSPTTRRCSCLQEEIKNFDTRKLLENKKFINLV